MAGISGGSCAGGGAGTGLIGKETPLHAVHQDCAKTAGNCLTDAKGLFKNALEHGGDDSDIFDDQEEGDGKVTGGHDGNQHVENFNGGVFAENNDSGQQNKDNRRIDRRNAESILKSGRDGIADDLADPTPADETGDGKQHSEKRVAPASAPHLLHKMVNVVSRTAPVAAVKGVLFLMELCQSGLDESGGGTD